VELLEDKVFLSLAIAVLAGGLAVYLMNEIEAGKWPFIKKILSRLAGE